MQGKFIHIISILLVIGGCFSSFQQVSASNWSFHEISSRKCKASRAEEFSEITTTVSDYKTGYNTASTGPLYSTPTHTEYSDCTCPSRLAGDIQFHSYYRLIKKFCLNMVKSPQKVIIDKKNNFPDLSILGISADYYVFALRHLII